MITSDKNGGSPVNYQRLLDAELTSLRGVRKRLLLHACCAPCASYVLEYLTEFFDISVYFYNPNIYPADEYYRRLGELERLIGQLPKSGEITLVAGEYEPERFAEYAAGLEAEREGGARCAECFRLRLERTARLASEMNADYFATTLTVSPHKNAALINKIGAELEAASGARYLPSDFKKRGGYQRSVALCAEYGVYRQRYCGCEYSLPSQ